MQFEQYEVVKILEINKKFDDDTLKFNKRLPRIGDIATIIEIYTTPCFGYELECCDKNGIPNWIIAFSPEEVKLELVSTVKENDVK